MPADASLGARTKKGDLMSEKFDLQKMLLEIRDDEAIETAKAKHLSQLQIQELVTRRKTRAVKPETEPTDAR